MEAKTDRHLPPKKRQLPWSYTKVLTPSDLCRKQNRLWLGDSFKSIVDKVKALNCPSGGKVVDLEKGLLVKVFGPHEKKPVHFLLLERSKGHAMTEGWLTFARMHRFDTSTTITFSWDDMKGLLLSWSSMKAVEQAAEPPLDVALKTEVRILSSRPLSWIRSSMKTTNLHSWLYPHVKLPSVAISLLKSNESPIIQGFLTKLKDDWIVSLRSLYDMFEKNLCTIFYVCCSDFVIMFLSSKKSYGAYISPSTSELRLLLKRNTPPPPTPPSPLSEVVSPSQTSLEVHGKEAVDALVQFLSSSDILATNVPSLVSPLMFENASLSTPKMTFSDASSDNPEMLSSIVMSGPYIPTWIISRLCAEVGADSNCFDVEFDTLPAACIGMKYLDGFYTKDLSF